MFSIRNFSASRWNRSRENCDASKNLFIFPTPREDVPGWIDSWLGVFLLTNFLVKRISFIFFNQCLFDFTF